MINAVINKLLNEVEITEIELREAFDEVFSGLANDIQTASFLTIANKVEQKALCSAMEAIKEIIKKPYAISNCENLIQNVTLNQNNSHIDISLAQDLICASADLGVCTSTFDSIKAKNNSFNVLSKMGVNIEKEIDYSTLEFEKLNFNYIFLPLDNPYFKYSENIRCQLPFENIFNTTLKLLNPLCAKNLFLGISDKNKVNLYANIALKLNKTNSIILSAKDGFCYVSPNGESYIAEAWKNKIFTYVLTPELLGLESKELEEIKCENNEQNALDILNIIQNKEKGAKYNVVVLNSALSLYISKKADSIMDGLNLAKNLIESGKVFEKFEQIKKFYS